MAKYSKRKQNKVILPANYNMARAVLDILIDASEHITLFASPYDKLRISWRKQWGVPNPPRWRYNRAMKYLEQLDEVQIIRENDQLFIKLTQKGKLKGLLNRLEIDFNSAKGQTWDGKWRLVMWDIPEASSRERDSIRRFFKSLGFFRLQHSVFVTPYPLPSSAISYLTESGLIKFIRFLRVDKIDNDKELRLNFNL